MHKWRLKSFATESHQINGNLQGFVISVSLNKTKHLTKFVTFAYKLRVLHMQVSNYKSFRAKLIFFRFVTFVCNGYLDH